MTSGNLFSKLMREDCKRRTWAFALVFLAFFFILPIGLALAMEDAANTQYYVYNGYRDFVQDPSMPLAVYQEKLLELKTKVVLSQAEFGNGMVVFLMMAAAVVMGVSGFSYLHNRKKVDFYHSIPVRRELIYSARYMGGILIVGVSYLINLILMFGVALAYGVGTPGIAGAMAGGLALNMLFFLLMYAAVVIAMMMTGNMVVGILASGVFFFFLPAVMLLLEGYCEIFFVTTARNAWTSDGSPFMWGMKYLSPFSVYITALDWKLDEIVKHVPELICSGFGVLALFFLGMQLYRIRPSESAGKAMAFKRTMAPIRILLVLGCGLAGGLFFWAMQSRLRWGLFGTVVFTILTHCIVEIIYHFDFKKLFGRKLQLVLCLGAGVLVFLSFRYDWYGYDSYLPAADEVVSASLELDIDSGWLNNRSVLQNDQGEYELDYKPAYENIEEDMKLTDMDLVMPLAKEGRRSALLGRDERLGIVKAVPQARSVSYIGGAEGPTSVFIASKIGGEDGESDPEAKEYYTGMTVCYQLANGRRVRRAYTIALSDVMDVYGELYKEAAYKEGLYPVFHETPGNLEKVIYREAGSSVYTGEDSRIISGLLDAYKTDFMALDTQTRIKEVPVGAISFVSKDVQEYINQNLKQMRSGGRGGYWDMGMDDFIQYWPVYPSFTHTLQILEGEGAKPGKHFAAGNIRSVTMNVQSLFYNLDSGSGLPQGEELADLQRRNPYYTKEGNLVITDPADIGQLMKAVAEDEFLPMDQFHQVSGTVSYCDVELEGGFHVSGILLLDRMTPGILEMFEGLPLEEIL